ncbi:MAG: type II toxin-antitoxin system RelE/ParE family toxin [Saprospiraceae bacterium]
MKYKIRLSPKAKKDIQAAIEWYIQNQSGLGDKFYFNLQANIEKLESNPFYQIRYDNVRCMPLKKFPYMLHFTIDESRRIVTIRAVFNTSMDPKNWTERET